MKAESVDLERGFVSWEEIYFDSPNLRAKYKLVQQGIEIHSIFDYDVNQILTYFVFHPGVAAENDPRSLESCTASNIEDNPLHRIFGYRYENTDGKRSRMYNSFEALQFGGNYKYAFNGTKIISDRGIPSDVYHGCLFSSSPGSTIDKTFYWSGRQKVIPASSINQVPIKIDTYGEFFTYPNMDGKAEKVDIWQIDNIPWFEGNPAFDEKIFQIPRGMYCKDYRKVKDLPNLPRYFSGRFESITFERNMDGKLQNIISEQFTELWYDSDSNLARVDFVVSIDDDIELFLYMGAVPVSGVYDVGQGIVYYTNKLSGECVPFSIKEDFVLLSKDSKRKLAAPNKILGFDIDKLEYKGKNFARNILCNVWAGQSQSGSSSEEFEEVYFSTNGWHTDSDEDEEYDFPVRITLIEFSVDSNITLEKVSETNIFKYKATQPSSSVYDISGCRNTQNQKYFFFAIQKDAKDLLGNRQKFLRAVRDAIKDYSKIGSPLRVQDVDIYVSSPGRNVIVGFSLMDSPQLFGKSSKEPGTSLLAAEANLRRAIDNGDFAIEVVVDPKKEALYIHALPGSLVVAIPNANPHPAEKSMDYEEWDSKTQHTEESTKYSHLFDERKDVSQVPDLMFADSKGKTKGYSPGALGGLAVGMLILGIALGIAAMYFYLMKYGQQNQPHVIMMEEKQ